MNLAMIFAMLLQSGICGQTEFHDADGRTLLVMVCPRMTQPGGNGPAVPPGGDAPEAPAQPPGSPT